MHSLTLLAQNAINGSAGNLSESPITAYGKRLVDLSEALDNRTLCDEAIVRYLDEVTVSCERQLDRLEALNVEGEYEGSYNNLLCYLESILDIIEQFDDVNHSQLQALVQKADLQVTIAAVSLNGQAAA
jgi:hypothetical protein